MMLAIALVTLAGAGAAGAQDSSAAHASRFARISGIVIDSLHETPLANADVVIDGTNRSARTDASGDFRIDSVPPGAIRIGVFHPLLDSVGVSIASPPIVAHAGDSLLITLATPSSATIAARACQSVPSETGALATPQSTGPGVIVGRILDADNDEPVRNVRVSFIWVQFEASKKTGFHQFRHVRLATTGASGVFHLCHVPLSADGSLEAIRRDGGAAAAAEPIDRSLSPRALLSLVTMHVPALVAPTIAELAATAVVTEVPAPGSAPAAAAPPDAAAPAPAPGSPAPAPTAGTSTASKTPVRPVATPPAHRYATGSAVLTGQVFNMQGQAVAQASAFVKGAADSALTDGTGKFTLHNLPSGTRSLVVRSVGYEPVERAVELTSRAPATVVVPFTARATPALAPVVVTARLDEALRKVGFELRKHSGMGTFWTLPDIEKQKAYEFHDLFGTFPGLKIDYNEQGQASLMAARGEYACIGQSPQGQSTVGSNCGPCVAYVIDGHPFLEMQEGELDEYVRPDDVGAIEVYQESQVPHSLAGTRTDCINIVIWTKGRLGV
jgi:CarboxypepD_reg-like domain/Carboxypeptidase regulatory-like domain